MKIRRKRVKKRGVPCSNKFWSIRGEVIFRGFSEEQIIVFEKRIKDLISEFKKENQDVTGIREIKTIKMDVHPFVDEVG